MTVEITVGNDYSLNNILNLGYKKRMIYYKNITIKRNLLCEKI